MPWKLISGTVAANAVIRPLAVDMRYLRPDGSAETPRRSAVCQDKETKLAPVSTTIGTNCPLIRTSTIVLSVGVGAKNGLAGARAFLRDDALSRRRGRRDGGGAGRIDPWLDAIREQLRREQGNRERADEEQDGGLQHGVALDGRPAREFERNRHCRRRGQRFCKYARIKLTGPGGEKVRGAVADRAASARLAPSENEALYDGRAQPTRLQIRRSVERRDRAGTCLEHGEEGIATVQRGEVEGQRPGLRERDQIGFERDARVHGKKCQPPPQTDAKGSTEAPAGRRNRRCAASRRAPASAAACSTSPATAESSTARRRRRSDRTLRRRTGPSDRNRSHRLARARSALPSRPVRSAPARSTASPPRCRCRRRAHRDTRGRRG